MRPSCRLLYELTGIISSVLLVEAYTDEQTKCY